MSFEWEAWISAFLSGNQVALYKKNYVEVLMSMKSTAVMCISGYELVMCDIV